VCAIAGRIVTAYLEDLGSIACVDVVAGGRPCITGENGKIRSGDAEGGAAVISIAITEYKSVS
jgi:hypothetical protein